MSQISSINFKKSFAINTQHNDRTLPPSYLISDTGCEVNRNHQEALKLKNKMIDDAIKTYENNRKSKAPRFKAKSYEWSAVVNIKPDSTMQDLENLANFLEKKYKFQCYQIAIHRDEGHIEKGKKVINHHAHLEFITLDKETGKSIYSRAYITPAKLRQIQTEVAEILGMERGVDKRLSGAKRVEPRLYAKIKEDDRKQQEALKLEIAQNKKEIESSNELLEEYDELLEKEKQKNKDLNAENNELKQKIATQQLQTQPQKQNLSNSFTSYQEKIAFNIYKSNLKFDFKGFYVDSKDEKVIFKKSGINVEDSGNKLTAKGTDTKEQVRLMLEIAQAKGWNLAVLEVRGDDEFKQEAQRQIVERLKKEKEEQELKAKNELSNLRLELEKEQQKTKDLTASNEKGKEESESKEKEKEKDTSKNPIQQNISASEKLDSKIAELQAVLKQQEQESNEKAFISDIAKYPMSKRFTFKKPAKELEQDEIIALATLWFMPLEQNNRNYIKEILLEAKANNPVFNTIENPHRALTLIATNNNNNMTLGNESTRVLFKFLTTQPQNERDSEIVNCIMGNKKAIERVKNGMHPYQNTTINQNKIKIIEVLDYMIKNKSITKTIARQR